MFSLVVFFFSRCYHIISVYIGIYRPDDFLQPSLKRSFFSNNGVPQRYFRAIDTFYMEIKFDAENFRNGIKLGAHNRS
jgi:hypothetical protein